MAQDNFLIIRDHKNDLGLDLLQMISQGQVALPRLLITEGELSVIPSTVISCSLVLTSLQVKPKKRELSATG